MADGQSQDTSTNNGNWLTNWLTQRTQEVLPFARAGSWGTPELGATEVVSDFIGNPRNEQGGSTLINNPTSINQADLQTSIPLSQLTGNNNVLSATNSQPDMSSEWKINPSGTTTNKTTTSSGGGGSAFPANQYIGWDPIAAQADWNAKLKAGTANSGGGGGGQSIEDQINSAYAPALQTLNDIINQLSSGAESARGNVASMYESGGKTIGREQSELEASLAEQGRLLGETARSAYADSLRNYNNLIQQGLARYGAGSSAGPAVQELVNQEFLRSRGAMGRQEVAGQQQLAGETLKMNNYIAQKKSDLEDWKKGALTQIDENLQSSLREIALRRGDIEANRTKDKIAALQRAVDQANSIKIADVQYRQNLANFAIEQMQNFANRALTVPEMAAIQDQVMKQLGSGFLENTGAAPIASYYNPNWYKKDTDENGNPIV